MANFLKIQPSTKQELAKIGISEHLTIEELIEFLWTEHDNFSEYLLQESARVDRLAMTCERCRKLYTNILKIGDTGKVYLNMAKAAKRLKSNISQREKEEELRYIKFELRYYERVVLNIPSDDDDAD